MLHSAAKVYDINVTHRKIKMFLSVITLYSFLSLVFGTTMILELSEPDETPLAEYLDDLTHGYRETVADVITNGALVDDRYLFGEFEDTSSFLEPREILEIDETAENVEPVRKKPRLVDAITEKVKRKSDLRKYRTRSANTIQSGQAESKATKLEYEVQRWDDERLNHFLTALKKQTKLRRSSSRAVRKNQAWGRRIDMNHSSSRTPLDPNTADSTHHHPNINYSEYVLSHIPSSHPPGITHSQATAAYNAATVTSNTKRSKATKYTITSYIDISDISVRFVIYRSTRNGHS